MASIDSSPEILAQVQEVIIPIILFTFEHKLLGMSLLFSFGVVDLTRRFVDLFDNMYDLVDSLTFKLRAISPSMWPIFEATYELYKNDACDFLEGVLHQPVFSFFFCQLPLILYQKCCHRWTTSFPTAPTLSRRAQTTDRCCSRFIQFPSPVHSLVTTIVSMDVNWPSPFFLT